MNTESIHEFFSLSNCTLPVTATVYSALPCQTLFPAHWHQQLELLAVIEGDIRVVCGDTVHTLTAGEVLFVNPYESHLGTAGENGVTYRCIIVEPSLWYEALAEGTIAALPRIQNRIADSAVASMITTIEEEYRETKPGYELFVRANLLLIFSRLSRHYRAADTAPESDARIGDVMRYIGSHYAEPLSTRHLADMFGFSLSYFCRYFKNATGTTILEYINAVRLSHACRLLQQTDMPVSGIAARVGYTGTNYFVRQFHTSVGCSPLQFRKQTRS